MSYTINPNAKNRWARNAENTMDLSLETDASSVYLDNGRTLEQEIGEGSMVSNVATIDNGIEKVIDGTYDGAYEYCQMQGRSLVNLFNSKQITPSLHFSSNNDGKYENIVKSNGLIEFDIVGSENPRNYQYINMGKVNVDLLKPNTRYLVLFEEITGIDTVSIRDGNSANTVTDYTKVGGRQYVILTTLSEWQKSNQILYLYVQSKTGIHVKVKNAMIIEYQESMENWDLDYFEGLCDVKMPILKSVGKNLAKAYINNETTETIENSYVKVIKASNATQDIDYTDKTKYIPIKPNTHYSCSWQLVSGSIQTKGSVSACFAFCDKNKEVIKWVSGANQLSPKNAYYIKRVRLHWGNTEAMLKDFKFTMMLEENKSVTEFEPYKTSILTTPEEVILRKVGKVYDSYNALTGEYVQRIKERVFNGSETWVQNGQHTDGSYRHICNTYTDAKTSSNNVLCDKMSFVKVNSSTGEGMTSDIHITFTTTTGKIQIATTKPLSELKTWLSQNPITVQYELVEPITTIVESLTTPFAYQNGHIILESGYEGQSLLPILEYSTVVNKTGLVENVAKTIQRQEKQLTMLEKMLIQNIINLDYNNTLLTLKNEMEEML